MGGCGEAGGGVVRSPLVKSIEEQIQLVGMFNTPNPPQSCGLDHLRQPCHFVSQFSNLWKGLLGSNAFLDPAT